ncbi:hypothetical protein M433DRAFT_155579 [Acidomyces richmondensis BFW]|nr:MAG: hypothetical protein FE78DRAFT_91322 [Acidomyces sp. 'richmondensis']KYG44480.1 hypothetical protein M433DRAFT_155579 [Acidomyces richmondensis BFW]
MAGKNHSQDDEDPSRLNTIHHHRQEPRPDYSQPLPRRTLPKDLQEKLDSEEKWWSLFTEGKADDSTNSTVRYAAYTRSLRTLLLSAHRYVAYTSDIGESFRPVAHPRLVSAAYGISWAYILGDVGHEGYKAYIRNQAVLHPKMDALADVTAADAQVTPGRVAPLDHWGTVMAQRAVFQSIASMGLPAFTIHSVVKYSGRAMKNVKNVRIRTWGPIGLGLAIVPALPMLFDKPVEEATEKIFQWAFETVGGPAAVGHSETSGEAGTDKRKQGILDKVKEKEL